MKNEHCAIAVEIDQWWYVTWSISGAFGIRPVGELHALNAISAKNGGRPVACTVMGIFPTSEAAQEYRADMRRAWKEKNEDKPA